MATSEFVTRLRADIAARIDELAPRAAEHTMLSALLASMDAKVARRSGYGARQRQVLKAVNSRPGSTPRAIADALDIPPTLVYAPLLALNQRGKVHRHDGRWYSGPAKGTQAS